MNTISLANSSPHNLNLLLPQSQQITMSVDETMAALSIGRTMVYELIRNNAIRSVKIGKKRLVIRQSCIDYISDLESYGMDRLDGE